jgi:hypothetical protein
MECLAGFEGRFVRGRHAVIIVGRHTPGKSVGKEWPSCFAVHRATRDPRKSFLKGVRMKDAGVKTAWQRRHARRGGNSSACKQVAGTMHSQWLSYLASIVQAVAPVQIILARRTAMWPGANAL